MKILYDSKGEKDGKGVNAIFMSCRKFLMEIAVEFLNVIRRLME